MDNNESKTREDDTNNDNKKNKVKSDHALDIRVTSMSDSFSLSLDFNEKKLKSVFDCLIDYEKARHRNSPFEDLLLRVIDNVFDINKDNSFEKKAKVLSDVVKRMRSNYPDVTIIKTEKVKPKEESCSGDVCYPNHDDESESTEKEKDEPVEKVQNLSDMLGEAINNEIKKFHTELEKITSDPQVGEFISALSPFLKDCGIDLSDKK